MLRHKAGDTFRQICSGVEQILTHGELPINDFSGWTVLSSIRHKCGDLLAQLNVVYLDRAKLSFALECPDTVTRYWCKGTYIWDVQVKSPDGQVQSAKSVPLQIVRDVTMD